MYINDLTNQYYNLLRIDFGYINICGHQFSCIIKKKPNSFKAMLKEQLSYQCIVLLDIALDWKFNFMDHLIFEINVNLHSTNIVETLV